MNIVEKVWGKEQVFENNVLYCLKKLYLKKGYQCSIHCHKLKDETFLIDSGLVEIEYKLDKSKIMKPGEVIRIYPYEYHRFKGLEDSVIIEVSTTHIDEDSYRQSRSGRIKDHV